MENPYLSEDNRLGLSPEQVQFEQTIRSPAYINAITAMNIELLDSSCWVPWYAKFIRTAKLIGGPLYEYIVNGPVHPLLTPVHESMIDNALFLTVSNPLLEIVQSEGLSGSAALKFLKDKYGKTTIFQAIEIIGKLLERPMDGSIPPTEYFAIQEALTQELFNFSKDYKKLIGLLVLYAAKQPNLIHQLYLFPQSIDPKELPRFVSRKFLSNEFNNAGEQAIALDAPGLSGPSSPANTENSCRRCGANNHLARGCLSKVTLESWDKRQPKKQRRLNNARTSAGIV